MQIAKFGKTTSRFRAAFSRNIIAIMSVAIFAPSTFLAAQTPPLPHGSLPATKYSAPAWTAHNPCTHPSETIPPGRFSLPGLGGRPYRDQLPGGCECGNPRGITRQPDASVYWPAPVSALTQQRNPQLACWWETTGRQQFFEPLDRLGNFQGVGFRRSDNGYCGPSADPYGCLSASRQK